MVFTRFRNHAGSAYERLIGWDRLRTGPETDLVPELVTLATRVIEKAQYSAFTPEFEALVRQAGWRRLLFCGIATDGCVLKSAVDAFERDLRPIVVLDACASHGGNDVHECGLTLLGRFIGRRQLVDMTEALAMLDAS